VHKHIEENSTKGIPLILIQFPKPQVSEPNVLTLFYFL